MQTLYFNVNSNLTVGTILLMQSVVLPGVYQGGYLVVTAVGNVGLVYFVTLENQNPYASLRSRSDAAGTNHLLLCPGTGSASLLGRGECKACR